MSSTLWWFLVGSVPAALVIMSVAFIVLRVRINKVKKQYRGMNKDNLTSAALNREDHGQLLWDLREKTAHPLGDMQMEFAINTVLRNEYKRLYIKGFPEKYELITLTKKTKIKESDATFDFALINFNIDLIDKIDAVMKRAEPNSIIMITNVGKTKKAKELLGYLKLTGVRHEFQKVEEGIILIAK